jgi:hypothetical protein
MLQVAQYCLKCIFLGGGPNLAPKSKTTQFSHIAKGLKTLLVSINFVSFMRAHPNFIHKSPSTKIHNKIICFMLVISCGSYVGLKAPWLFIAIAYLMLLQFWGEGKLHVTR